MVTIKTVKEMHVRCMLPVRNLNRPGRAASDCCLAPATAAVIMEDGSRMWRCEFHKSIRAIGNSGQPYVREIIQNDPVPV